jgi:trk system potassium uptake protein TrkH
VIRRLSRVGPGLNWQLVVPVVSGALLAAAIGMAICFVVALAGDDGEALAFGVPAAVVIPLAALGVRYGARLRSMPLRARDGFFAVTAAWVVSAAFGAVPLLLDGTFARPLDAVFESMSGFTTTGATLLADVEAQPDAVLLWRSLMQWIGGVGIVVLVVAIAPATGLASQRLFYAEMTGVTAERLTPRIAETAKIIWGIYLTLTGLGFAAYWLAGMGPFDGINHSLTTIATGGFSTRNGSLAAFDSLAIELVAIVFMTLGGINFAFYWRAIRGGSIWPQAAEVRLYLLILASATAAVTASLLLNDQPGGFAPALRDAAFTVTSTVTSAGYTTVDFNDWNDFARASIVLLMFVGGCAGSTAGGLKVMRIMLLSKTAGQEVQRQLRPKAVQVLRVGGRVFSEDVRRGVLGFFTIYVLVAVAGTMAMLATGFDLLTASSTAVAALNLLGLGLGQIGATDNFQAVSDAGRVVLAVLMLVGRLEVFTVLVLLTPAFWRRNVA